MERYVFVYIESKRVLKLFQGQFQTFVPAISIPRNVYTLYIHTVQTKPEEWRKTQYIKKTLESLLVLVLVKKTKKK